MDQSKYRLFVPLYSETLFMKMADEIVNKGLNKLGYEYIIIDDCWLDHQRSPEGKLVPDPRRFPSGIKWLSDYVHSKGLKFGIYEDYGNYTSGGYPGILGHLEEDAKTFADWGVDYIKVDGCYAGNIHSSYLFIPLNRLDGVHKKVHKLKIWLLMKNSQFYFNKSNIPAT